jgi:uncharacterized protein (UPF0297 family)
MSNLPVEIVNQILGYFTNIEDPLFVPHMSNQNKMIYRLNNKHQFLDKIKDILKHKIKNPIKEEYHSIIYNDCQNTPAYFKLVYTCTITDNYLGKITYSYNYLSENVLEFAYFVYRRLSRNTYLSKALYYTQHGKKNICDILSNTNGKCKNVKEYTLINDSYEKPLEIFI